MSLADAIEQALPARRCSGVPSVLLASCRLTLRRPLWPIAHPPQGLIDAFAEVPEVPPEGNLDFVSALTRLLTASCVGLQSGCTERNHT
jgi:hypothetical protein